MGLFDSLKGLTSDVKNVVSNVGDSITTARHTVSGLVNDAGVGLRRVGAVVQDVANGAKNVGDTIRRTGNQTQSVGQTLSNDALFAAGNTFGNFTAYTGSGDVNPNRPDGPDVFEWAAIGIGGAFLLSFLGKK